MSYSIAITNGFNIPADFEGQVYTAAQLEYTNASSGRERKEYALKVTGCRLDGTDVTFRVELNLTVLTGETREDGKQAWAKSEVTARLSDLPKSLSIDLQAYAENVQDLPTEGNTVRVRYTSGAMNAKTIAQPIAIEAGSFLVLNIDNEGIAEISGELVSINKIEGVFFNEGVSLLYYRKPTSVGTVVKNPFQNRAKLTVAGPAVPVAPVLADVPAALQQ